MSFTPIFNSIAGQTTTVAGRVRESQGLKQPIAAVGGGGPVAGNRRGCWGSRGQKSIGLSQFEPQNARKRGKCCCVLSRGDWDLCCSVNILAVVNAAHVECTAGRKVKKTIISTVPRTNNPWEGEAPAAPDVSVQFSVFSDRKIPSGGRQHQHTKRSNFRVIPRHSAAIVSRRATKPSKAQGSCRAMRSRCSAQRELRPPKGPPDRRSAQQELRPPNGGKN